jgi:hypothetical protein
MDKRKEYWFEDEKDYEVGGIKMKIGNKDENYKRIVIRFGKMKNKGIGIDYMKIYNIEGQKIDIGMKYEKVNGWEEERVN